MDRTLPPAPWTHRADLAALIAALGGDERGGSARYVGGAVRDTLLGLEVKDIDLATPLEPDEVIARLKAAGIRSIPTGIEHGTITALLPGGAVEITTLRHDVSTDGRRATVAFARDWQEDAARRDFTINALYADPASGTIFDYFGGLDDLAAHRLRFIGDARQRIREDHLRILRYFRFQARFGGDAVDGDAEAACAELSATLKGLSRERVGMELLNLLSLPDPSATVTRMARLGVLPVILPEGQPDALAALIAAEQGPSIPPDPIRRLAALLPADPELSKQIASRFRLSGAQRKRLGVAADRLGDQPPAQALAYRLGREQALDRLLLTGGDAAPLADWEIPTFPLKGGAIVARGIIAGPQVARILLTVEDRWVAEGFPDAARIAQLLDAALQA